MIAGAARAFAALVFGRFGRLGRWLRRHLLGTFLWLGLVALVLGLIGMYQHLSADPEAFTWANVVFFTVTLFLADGTVFEDGGTYPPALEIARFLAPTATAVGLADAASTLFARRFERFRARHARDHIVVCGSGPTASALVDKLVHNNQLVVLVAEDAEQEYPDAERPPNLLRVVGDPVEPMVLGLAGIARAEAVYSCLEDTAANLAVALTARRALRTSRSGGRPMSEVRADNPLRCLAQVGDLSLLPHLRARRIGLEDDPGFRLDFFAAEVLGAHAMLNSNPPSWASQQHDDAAALQPAPLVVLGLSGLGRAVVMELARRWLDAAGPDGPRLPIVIAGPDAPRQAQVLRLREQALRRVDLRPHDTSNGRLPDEVMAPPPQSAPEFVYVCHSDEDEALLHGLEAARALGPQRLGEGGTRVVIRTGRRRGFQDVFGPRDPAAPTAPPDPLLDNVQGGLRFFAVSDEALPLDPGADDLIERFARAIHAKYLENEQARGVQMGSRDTMRPWEELSEDSRQSNRAQAIGFSEVMRRRNWMLMPVGDADPEFAFTDEEIEELAKAEHERWQRERASRGFRYGPVFDRDELWHPAMVDWDQLDQENREKNRQFVLNMPQVLAQAGLRIVRLTPDDPTV